jgi:beta-lactamase class A
MTQSEVARGASKLHILLGLMILTLGVAIGGYARPFFDKTAVTNSPRSKPDVRQNGAKMSLTSPLLECTELPEGLSVGDRLGIEAKIKDFLEVSKKRGDIVNAGIYYRDLNNGPWFGVNDEFKFTPASLLKIPLAMSFYALEHAEPGILEMEVEYVGSNSDANAGQEFVPGKRLSAGSRYKVRELIELMLKESSNEAALLLTEIAGEKQMQNIYEDFGQPPPHLGQDYQVDVHTYASFFRVLYNATYLDRVDSEEVLSMLTQSSFVSGIRGGVPSSVVVANKFGERDSSGGEGGKRLHDCGIVYAAEKPYIVCIMTQGSDYAKLSEFIRAISALIYEEIVH